jgi:hypothetical protein
VIDGHAVRRPFYHINPEKHGEWAANPDDLVGVASLKVAGTDGGDIELGLVVNFPAHHVHASFAHELRDMSECFEDGYEFEGVVNLCPPPNLLI